MHLAAVLWDDPRAHVGEERGFLFLRDGDRVLPKARIHILKGDHGQRLFGRGHRPGADERFELDHDAGERSDHGEESSPGELEF